MIVQKIKFYTLKKILKIKFVLKIYLKYLKSIIISLGRFSFSNLKKMIIKKYSNFPFTY